MSNPLRIPAPRVSEIEITSTSAADGTNGYAVCALRDGFRRAVRLRTWRLVDGERIATGTQFTFSVAHANGIVAGIAAALQQLDALRADTAPRTS